MCASETSEDQRWGWVEEAAPSYRLFTFMKRLGVQKEDQGNPEQKSHRVLAGGGPAALSKLYPHPFPLPSGKEQCLNLQWEKKQKSSSRALGENVASREETGRKERRPWGRVSKKDQASTTAGWRRGCSASEGHTHKTGAPQLSKAQSEHQRAPRSQLPIPSKSLATQRNRAKRVTGKRFSLRKSMRNQSQRWDTGDKKKISNHGNNQYQSQTILD